MNNKKTSLGIGHLLVALLIGCAPIALAKSEEPPNIVVITGDDHGFQLGCCGDPNARTPELDRFARENVFYTHAYVSQSSCSPSRSSFLTGLYPHESGQIGLAHLGYRMRGDITETLPRILTNHGYHCGTIGKLHVAPFTGFDFSFARFSDFNASPDVAEADRPDVATRDWKRVTGAVQEFLTESKKPFFLYVNLFDPHHPMIQQVNGLPKNPVSGSQLAPLAETMRGKANEIAGYYNGLERMDAIFGRIREVLVENNVWENSLVVYWGDNGQPFDGAKTTASEAGLRVPLIIHWPGIRAGSQINSPVSTIDLFRTVLDAAGAPAPGYAGGLSLLPTLRNGNELPKRAVFAERNAHGVAQYFPERVVYRGNLKVAVNFTKPAALQALDRRALAALDDPTAFTVFDVTLDPNEMCNLAGDEKSRPEVQSMLGDLQLWMTKTGDFLLFPQRRDLVSKAHADASAKGQAAHFPLAPEKFTEPLSAQK
ncbi:MAG: sulfatase-like hydrolase/transferase [Terrimicrobiaceae bacterium]